MTFTRAPKHKVPAMDDLRRSHMQAMANNAVSRAAPAQQPGGTVESEGREFLTFRLGAEEYGIEILKVQEIRGWESPTAIANTPEFIKGVINLRGIIVPIVDLRLKFKGEAKYDSFTVVIILSVARRVVGIVVDAVSDVITLAPQQMRPAPEFGGSLDTRYITGLGTVGDRMLILADIERLMTSKDMQLVDQDAHGA
jgi:purine-binding chemotaxis protein CheW